VVAAQYSQTKLKASLNKISETFPNFVSEIVFNARCTGGEFLQRNWLLAKSFANFVSGTNFRKLLVDTPNILRRELWFGSFRNFF